MKKKKVFLIVIALCTILSVGVGITVAYLMSKSQEIENTFTYGDVNIELRESPTGQYIMLPGTDIAKDPTVIVKAPSEACWIFLKINKTSNFEQYMTYTLAEGWTSLPGEVDIYYRQMDKAKEDVSLPILTENVVSVNENITEEELEVMSTNPKLTYTAYAIQMAEIPAVDKAWEFMKNEMEVQ